MAHIVEVIFFDPETNAVRKGELADPFQIRESGKVHAFVPQDTHLLTVCTFGGEPGNVELHFHQVEAQNVSVARPVSVNI